MCEKGDFETARNVLDEMSNKRVQPDFVSYKTLLDGYLNEGDVDLFKEILKEALNKELKPNVVAYNCRISKCQNSDNFKAEELLNAIAPIYHIDLKITKMKEPLFQEKF